MNFDTDKDVLASVTCICNPKSLHLQFGKKSVLDSICHSEPMRSSEYLKSKTFYGGNGLVVL